MGLLLLAGCGTAQPGPEQAARAILAAEPFTAAKEVRLATTFAGTCSQALEAQPEWSRWVQLGLAMANPVITSSGLICRLDLDETVAREAQSWIHRVAGSAPVGAETIAVPVAVRTLLRVTEIRPAGSGAAEVAFEWQWRLNLAGQKLGLDTNPKPGWAQLVLEERGWRASRVDVGGQ